MAEEGKTLFSKDQKDFDDVFRRAAEGKKIDEAQENIDWLNKQHYTSYDKFMEGMDENLNDTSSIYDVLNFVEQSWIRKSRFQGKCGGDRGKAQESIRESGAGHEFQCKWSQCICHT